MKRHTSVVFLMELTLVILFFSLSAVVTLRLFVTAHRQEQQSARHSDAIELAQNTAEMVYAQGSSFFDTADGWSLSAKGESSTVYTCTDTGSGLLLEVSLWLEETAAGTLETGEVRVTDTEKAEEPLCRLPFGKYTPGEAAS